MAFITVTDIRHRHLSTDDIHQINKSIKPFVADKKNKIKNLPLYNLTLERTLMTCDLKKLGCFFFPSPWDETFCANDVSWYEHNADVGVCHKDAYNSPCPWPPSQEGSKHSEVTVWAVSCQTRDPSLSPGVGGARGVGMAGNWGGGLHQHSFVSAGVTHAPERRHTPCINQNLRCTPSALG